MPIPNYEAIMLPLLKHITDGQEHSMQKLISILAEQFHLSEAEKKQLLPSGRQTAFENRAAWAKFYLQKACLIESSKRGIFKITDRGINVLKQSPSEITNDFLMQFTEFADFKKSSKSNINIDHPIQPPEINEPQNPEYSLSNCAEDTGFEEAELKRWVSAIGRKNQAIFYGSPGTGKTFIAEKIAQHLIGGSEDFYELVQFHPAYAYEDFIQGIRPQTREDGTFTYQLISGRFLEFCKKAESCDGICVLIIDEINRANLAQVFGELMYLLEYRDKEIPLAGGNTFRIPSNVRIIGTMNTADRSIALVDHALRRRFAFIEIRPNYDVLRKYHEKKNTGFKVDGLIQVLQKLNLAIADKNYELGISFFLTEKLAEDIEDIWKMEIEPYLEEYFFDRLEKVEDFRWDKIEKQVLP